MHWKTKRLVGTAIAAAAPYLAVTFVHLDATEMFSTEFMRVIFLIWTPALAVITYTYPGWSWSND